MNKLDFYFALALIALFGSAASLTLEFQNAGYEYENLSGSLAPLVRTHNDASDINEALNIQAELDDLEQQLQIMELEKAK